MRKSAFGNARYINAIGSIFEWGRSLSTSNAETQTLTDLISYQRCMQCDFMCDFLLFVANEREKESEKEGENKREEKMSENTKRDGMREKCTKLCGMEIKGFCISFSLYVLECKVTSLHCCSGGAHTRRATCVP